jgi:hypothetical protein
MRGVSARFLSTIRGSHNAVHRARVCPRGQTGVDPDGVEIEVLGGDVISSSKNDVRSTLSLTTSEAWPKDATGLLTPYGNEIYIERGVSYGNGQTEYVGLGYFRIDTPEQDDAPNGEITIAAPDRTQQIIDERWVQPARSFVASLTRLQVVEILVGEVWPDIPIEWVGTGSTTTLGRTTIVTEPDRYALLKKFLTAWGRVGYFDYRGHFIVKPVPALTGPPVWTIDAGANGVLVQMSRALSREGIYNAVVARGEGTDQVPPAYGLAVQRSGPVAFGDDAGFGSVPRFYRSPFLTTNAQANNAAVSLLRKSIGLPYRVELRSLPNPALEVDDIVKVRYPADAPSRSLRSELHVLDEVKIPLVAGAPVELSTRQQAGEDIGDVEESA